MSFKIVNKLARSYHRSTGIDLEDLTGEANLAYAQALEAKKTGIYNPSRSSFDTFVWLKVENHLRSVIKYPKYRPIPMVGREESEWDLGWATLIIRDLLTSLSEEAVFAVRLVVESPNEYLSQSRANAKRSIRRSLRHKGTTRRKIEKAFKSIRKVLVEV